MTDDDIARLAAAGHALRPDWPLASLRTFLAKRYAHEPVHRLAVALVLCALDPASQTPARLSENRDYWPNVDAEHYQPPRPGEQCPQHPGRRRDSCGLCRVEHYGPTVEPLPGADVETVRRALRQPMPAASEGTSR